MAIRFYFFLNVQGCKGDKLVFTQYAKEGGEGTGIHGAKLTQVYGEEWVADEEGGTCGGWKLLLGWIDGTSSCGPIAAEGGNGLSSHLVRRYSSMPTTQKLTNPFSE